MQEDANEWYKVEDNTNIDAPEEFVENSCPFMETSSFPEFDVSATNLHLWWVMQHLLQEISLEGLKVHVGNIHNDLQGDEMYDAVLHSVLVREHVNIDELAQKSSSYLEESQHEANLRSMMAELVTLIVRKLHNSHAIGDLRVEQKVQGNGAGELD